MSVQVSFFGTQFTSRYSVPMRTLLLDLCLYEHSADVAFRCGLYPSPTDTPHSGLHQVYPRLTERPPGRATDVAWEHMLKCLNAGARPRPGSFHPQFVHNPSVHGTTKLYSSTHHTGALHAPYVTAPFPRASFHLPLDARRHQRHTHAPPARSFVSLPLSLPLARYRSDDGLTVESNACSTQPPHNSTPLSGSVAAI